jgi:hypothetical protein
MKEDISMFTVLRTRLGASSSFLVATVAVAVLLLPAPSGAQQVARRFGVGVGIGDVHNIFATSAVDTTEDTVAAPAILFPIQITDWLRIEPEIAAFRHRHEEPINYSVNGVEVGVGIFPQVVRENLRIYYGARIGAIRGKERQTDTTPTRIGDITATSTQTRHGFYLAPAVGGEYLLSNRFGLGAEVQYRYTSVKGDAVSSLTGGPPGMSVSETEKFDTSVSGTRVMLVTRFYF